MAFTTGIMTQDIFLKEGKTWNITVDSYRKHVQYIGKVRLNVKIITKEFNLENFQFSIMLKIWEFRAVTRSYIANSKTASLEVFIKLYNFRNLRSSKLISPIRAITTPPRWKIFTFQKRVSNLDSHFWRLHSPPHPWSVCVCGLHSVECPVGL